MLLLVYAAHVLNGKAAECYRYTALSLQAVQSSLQCTVTALQSNNKVIKTTQMYSTSFTASECLCKKVIICTRIGSRDKTILLCFWLLPSVSRCKNGAAQHKSDCTRLTNYYKSRLAFFIMLNHMYKTILILHSRR